MQNYGYFRVVAGAVGCALAMLLAPAGAHAQLRPLEPFEWEALAPGRVVTARVGAGVEWGQRLSLAGTEGRLLELGNFAALWHTGRVALEASGTMVRVFDDRSVWAEPTGGAHAPPPGARVDAGDYRVATAVRLTPDHWPILGILRFGTRLPTTNNRVGIDRDQTDFFALAGVAYRRGPLLLATENGVGIFGTRLPDYEQADDWVYITRAAYALGPVTPMATLTGQYTPFHRVIRGNEDLGELRLGLRAGGRRWAEAQWVTGLTRFSPRSGLLVSVGASFGGASPAP